MLELRSSVSNAKNIYMSSGAKLIEKLHSF